jgi:hypothetical protein
LSEADGPIPKENQSKYFALFDLNVSSPSLLRAHETEGAPEANVVVLALHSER